MNRFLIDDFETLWRKYSYLGIKNIVSRMPPSSRPKLHCKIRKAGHEIIEGLTLLESQPLKDNHIKCWYAEV